MVKALAPGLNTMPLTSVSAEMETLLVLEDANVAVSEGPLGMVGGVQFAAWFQSPVAGFIFHVALPAKVLLAVESRSNSIATVTNNSGNCRRGRREGISSDIDEERRVMFFIIFPLVNPSPSWKTSAHISKPQRSAGSGVGLYEARFCFHYASPIKIKTRCTGKDSRRRNTHLNFYAVLTTTQLV